MVLSLGATSLLLIAATIYVDCCGRIEHPLRLLNRRLSIVLLVRRIDLRCCEIVFHVNLLSLNAIDLAQGQIKANEYLLNDELSEDQLVEVRHQIWQVAKIWHGNLEGDRASIEIQELDHE